MKEADGEATDRAEKGEVNKKITQKKTNKEAFIVP